MMKKFVLALLVISALMLGVACEKDAQKEEEKQDFEFEMPGDKNPIVLPEDTFE